MLSWKNLDIGWYKTLRWIFEFSDVDDEDVEKSTVSLLYKMFFWLLIGTNILIKKSSISVPIDVLVLAGDVPV